MLWGAAGVLPIFRHHSSVALVSARFIFLFVFSGYSSWLRLFPSCFWLSNPGLNRLASRSAKYWELPSCFRLVTGWELFDLKAFRILWQAMVFYLKILEGNRHPDRKISPNVSSVMMIWKAVGKILLFCLQQTLALRHLFPHDFSFHFLANPHAIFSFLSALL